MRVSAYVDAIARQLPLLREKEGPPLLRGHGDSQTLVLFPPKTLPRHFHRQKVLWDKPNIYICIALKIVNTPIYQSLSLIE